MSEKNPVNVAEASMMLEFASKPPMTLMAPIMCDFVLRITRDWFDARQAAGIGGWDGAEKNLSETIRGLRAVKS